MTPTEGSVADVGSEVVPGLDSLIEQTLSENAEPGDAGPDDGTPPDGSTTEEPQGVSGADQTADDGETQAGVAGPSDGETPAEPEPTFTPFQYDDGGEARQMDGVYVVPEEGIYVSKAAVPQFEQFVQRATQAEREVQALSQQSEAFDRIVQFQLPDANGQPQTYQGAPAVEMLRVALAQQAVSNQILGERIKDPTVLLSLLASDEQGNVRLNEQAYRSLLVEVENRQLRAEQQVRQQFQKVAGPLLSSPSATPSAPPTADAIQQGAPAIVAALAKQLQVTLPPDRQQFLAGQVLRYTRPAQRGERDTATGRLLRPGELVLDPDFATLLRQQAGPAGAPNGAAARFNQGQQQGRQTGKVAPKPAAKAPVTVQPDPPRRKMRAASWDDSLSEGIMSPEVQAALRGEL